MAVPLISDAQLNGRSVRPQTVLTFSRPCEYDAQTRNVIIREVWLFYCTESVCLNCTQLEKCHLLGFSLAVPERQAVFPAPSNNCRQLSSPGRPGAERINRCLLPVSRYCNPRPPSLPPSSPQTLWLHLPDRVWAGRREAINGTNIFIFRDDQSVMYYLPLLSR